MSERDELESYLWDKSGEADPTVVALEDLMDPLGHAPQAGASQPPLGEVVHAAQREMAGHSSSAQAASPLWRLVAVAAMVVVLGGAAIWALMSAPQEVKGPQPIAMTPGSPLKIAGRAEAVPKGEVIVAGPRGPRVAVADYGTVLVKAGSSVTVQEASHELVRLALDQGRLEVDLTVVAPPRFFQVDTPAGRVVDLGCVYRMAVDDAGALELEMLSGWVTIEHAKGRVVVPGGATVTSTKADGPQIPVFDDTRSEVVDTLRGARGANVWADEKQRLRAVLNMLALPHDTLIAWHLLDHSDPSVAAAAHATLNRLDPGPTGIGTAPSEAPNAQERALWLDHLYKGAWANP